MRPSRDEGLLPFVEFNAEAVGAPTILLIHGAFGDHRDWDLVWPHLITAGYHLIVPDLPCHGDASNLSFSIPLASEMLHILILARAHDRIAHVVGLSLGASIAVQLAASYPEVVSDSFVSGFGGIPSKSAWSSCVPYIVWLLSRIE